MAVARPLHSGLIRAAADLCFPLRGLPAAASESCSTFRLAQGLREAASPNSSPSRSVSSDAGSSRPDVSGDHWAGPSALLPCTLHGGHAACLAATSLSATTRSGAAAWEAEGAWRAAARSGLFPLSGSPISACTRPTAPPSAPPAPRGFFSLSSSPPEPKKYSQRRLVG